MKYVLFGLFTLLLICFSLGQEGINVGGFEFPSDFGAEEVPRNLSAPDVTTAVVFPSHNDGKIPSGAEVPIIIGFRNHGEKRYNITHIEASFNYPQDYTYFIQNFTAQHYHYLVGPSEEITLEYTIFPDPLLDMRDFGLVVSVYYHDGNHIQVGNNYTSIVYNTTVDIIELDSGFDAQSFFATIAIIAIIGVGGFFVYKNLSYFTKRQKGAKGGKSVSRPENTSNLENADKKKKQK
eukprot:TRINITY_DN688_c0_g1_i1.p1 TRINITY_DN688_c0_g1~~TRINITY_DN688_c0_g1_i1.p1  ORF type:complete len:236 (-),score=48.64 TRINITY_DN688_c0_g1_i1:116-823(-)